MCRCEPTVVDGYPFNQFIGEMFSQCVYNPTQYTSFILGMGNIGFWMFAQFPQLVQSCVEGKVDALSPMFIIQWLVGDLCNLIGCILTKQLPTQLYTAIYFCFMDVLMLGQYLFYQCGPKLLKRQLRSEEDDEESTEIYTEEITESSVYSDVRYHPDSVNERAPMLKQTRRKKRKRHQGPNDTDTSINSNASSSLNQNEFAASPPETPFGESDQVHQTHYQSTVKTYYVHMGVLLLPLIAIICMQSVSAKDVFSNRSRQLNEIRICDSTSPLEPWEHWVGVVSAWVSGILYFSARIPQIWKNFKRKSVEGLALPMFVCAVLGNTCYGLSILILPIENWGVWFLETFPYVLGSICTLTMSSVIIFQFFIYGTLPTCKKLFNRTFRQSRQSTVGLQGDETFVDIDRRIV